MDGTRKRIGISYKQMSVLKHFTIEKLRFCASKNTYGEATRKRQETDYEDYKSRSFNGHIVGMLTNGDRVCGVRYASGGYRSHLA